MVFCHEITHIRSHDNWKKLFFLAIETIFWWNPLAHFSGEEISTLIELSCDAKVASDMSEQECLDYATLLKKLLDFHDPHKTPASVSALVGGIGQMDQRIMALIQPSGDHHPRYIALALLVLVFVVSYSIVIQPARFPTNEMLINDVNNIDLISDSKVLLDDGSYITFENGKYHFYVNGNLIGSLYEEELSETSENTIPVLGGE